jgi:hypothetical protein
MICYGYIMVSKVVWFGVDVCDFQIVPPCRYFGFFCLGNFFGYFFPQIGLFSQSFGHPESQFKYS